MKEKKVTIEDDNILNIKLKKGKEWLKEMEKFRMVEGVE